MKSVMQSRKPFSINRLMETIPRLAKAGLEVSVAAAGPEPSWYRGGRKGHSPVKGIPIRPAYSLFTPPAKGTGSAHFTGPVAIIEEEVW
jgi:hypothetical protein